MIKQNIIENEDTPIDKRLVTSDGHKFSLIMQDGVAKTDFYKWIASKTKSELLGIKSQSISFFDRDTLLFQLGADNHYVDSSANPIAYQHTSILVINAFRKAWLQETVADPYLLNESAKHIWIGLELTPKINMISDTSQSDVMALILDNHLIKTRMKADEVTPEFYAVFDRSVLGSITKIAQGYNLPRPHNLINIITTDLLMQTDEELLNVDERDLHMGLLLNGVRPDTTDISSKLQAVATLMIQGVWGTKNGIAYTVHTRFMKEVETLMADGHLSQSDIVEELRIINDINNVYAEIGTLTDIHDTTQMYWKGFYQNLVLPLLRYDYKKIALGDNKILLTAFWKANGWTGTDAELEKVVEAQLASNIRRK